MGPVPVVVGAAGTEKTFRWLARSADGWLTTPMEGEIDAKIALLRRCWHEAGREGSPEITVLAGKPEPETLARYEDLGVTEVLFGLPDRPAEDVVSYLGRLAGKLGLHSEACSASGSST